MSTIKEHTLHLERLFDVPLDTLFAYFTDPELMKTWWSPGGTTMLDGTLDLQVGGRCRWKMRTAAGSIAHLNGVIKMIDPPHQLILTHHWEGAASETIVTLKFVAEAGGTRLLLTQEGISSRSMLAALQKGWAIPLDRLESEVTR